MHPVFISHNAPYPPIPPPPQPPIFPPPNNDLPHRTTAVTPMSVKPRPNTTLSFPTATSPPPVLLLSWRVEHHRSHKRSCQCLMNMSSTPAYNRRFRDTLSTPHKALVFILRGTRYDSIDCYVHFRKGRYCRGYHTNQVWYKEGKKGNSYLWFFESTFLPLGILWCFVMRWSRRKIIWSTFAVASVPSLLVQLCLLHHCAVINPSLTQCYCNVSFSLVRCPLQSPRPVPLFLSGAVKPMAKRIYMYIRQCFRI